MKKTFVNIGKIVGFFLCWGVAISIPLEFWEHPKFAGDNAALLRLYWELAPMVMTILVTIVFAKIVERKDRIRIPVFGKVVYNTVFGIVLGILWIGLVLLIAFKMDILHIENRVEVSNLFTWILAIFFNTIMQELMARGYMFSLLRREYNLGIGICITTAVFTLMHGGAFEAGLLAVMNVVTTSILLSLVSVYTNGLWAPILMHFIWNSVGRMFGIVSLADDYPVMFETKIMGNNLISGGSVGIEGSIIVLIINCVFIVGLLIYKRFKRRKAFTLTNI